MTKDKSHLCENENMKFDKSFYYPIDRFFHLRPCAVKSWSLIITLKTHKSVHMKNTDLNAATLYEEVFQDRSHDFFSNSNKIVEFTFRESVVFQ